MADSKITALTSIGTSTDPANDPLVLVDVSDTSMAASGTTKKVTLNNLLSTSPTATGNFTITGDLTVDTSTLKVDSANNRVGIGTASPVATLQSAGTFTVSGGSGASSANGLHQYFDTGTNTGYISAFHAGVDNRDLRYDAKSHVWSIASGVALTLNSSGNLGLGVTPSAWATAGGYVAMQVGGIGLYGRNAAGNELDVSSNGFYSSAGWKYITTSTATRYAQQSGQHQWFTAPSGTAGNAITFTQAMTLDASGNLVVGKSSISATTVGFESRANGTVNSTLASSVDANATYAAYSTGAAAYRFYVGMGGTVYATNTTISAISDARLKENVQDIDVGLGAILALKPRKFDWKEGKGKNIKGDRGFIAQEFETVFPNLIDEWKDPAPAGEAPYKSVRQDLIPVLVKAIQELTARVQTLETR